MGSTTPAGSPGPATAKGRARRNALVEAAAGLLAGHGPAAVTARAVAARAGVPLAATTYYFADTASLLSEAATASADRHLADARAVIALGPDDDAAAFLLRVVTGGVQDVDGLAAMYERVLASCRHPAMATALSGFDRRLQDVVADALVACGRRPDLARSVLALSDGAIVGSLLAASPDPMSTAREILAQALDAIAPPAARSATHPAASG